MRHKLAIALAVVSIALLSACGRSQSAQPAANEQIVREFFAAIDSGNLERVRQLAADDLILYALGVPQVLSKDGLVEAIKSFYAAFPDNTHVIEQTLAADDRVAVVITQHATSKGPYEGAPATGQRVTISAIHIWPGASFRELGEGGGFHFRVSPSDRLRVTEWVAVGWRSVSGAAVAGPAAWGTHTGGSRGP